jgi:hypothetical protein
VKGLRLSLFNIVSMSDIWVDHLHSLLRTLMHGKLMYLLASIVWISVANDVSRSSSHLPSSQRCHDGIKFIHHNMTRKMLNINELCTFIYVRELRKSHISQEVHKIIGMMKTTNCSSAKLSISRSNTPKLNTSDLIEYMPL